jgi:hypothetical protein
VLSEAHCPCISWKYPASRITSCRRTWAQNCCNSIRTSRTPK